MNEYIVREYLDHNGNVKGTEYLNKDGQYHREGNLPAIVHANGSEGYYKNGQLHCENGPAIVYANGTEEYWLNGQHMTKEEHEKATKPAVELKVGDRVKVGNRVLTVKKDLTFGE